LLIQDDGVSTAKVKGDTWSDVWAGLICSQCSQSSLCQLMTHSSLEKTEVILTARWKKPWLLVTEPRTTTRARVSDSLCNLMTFCTVVLPFNFYSRDDVIVINVAIDGHGVDVQSFGAVISTSYTASQKSEPLNSLQ